MSNTSFLPTELKRSYMKANQDLTESRSAAFDPLPARRAARLRISTASLFLALLAAVLFPVIASAQTCDPAPAGLVGWWPAAGNANDLLGANNGAVKGGATAMT